ncbi:MAG: hypothetical protein DWQ04_17945 [Chloroflexi bacterium]|nr:MAG: hypothetical protein DWQ04_17945 [Chloroflexota bacterium]
MSETWITLITGSSITIITGFILLLIEYRTGWFASSWKKELSYEVVTVTSLVNTENIMGSPVKLTVNLGEHTIDNPTSIVVKVKNTGRMPIVPSDFHAPITIDYGNVSSYLFTLNSFPSDMKIEWEESINWIENERKAFIVKPMLFNPGDFFTIGMITDGYDGIEVLSRVAGIKNILRVDPEAKRQVEAKFFNIILIVLSLMAIIMLCGLIAIFLGSLLNGAQ